MDLQEAIKAAAERKKCKFGIWLETQDPDLEYGLKLALQTVSVMRLHKAVKLMGFEGAKSPMESHLEEACSCKR
jgi:hypothetical protein